MFIKSWEGAIGVLTHDSIHASCLPSPESSPLLCSPLQLSVEMVDYVTVVLLCLDTLSSSPSPPPPLTPLLFLFLLLHVLHLLSTLFHLMGLLYSFSALVCNVSFLSFLVALISLRGAAKHSVVHHALLEFLLHADQARSTYMHTVLINTYTVWYSTLAILSLHPTH